MRAAQILEMHDVSFAFRERAASNSSQISPNEVGIFETGKHPKQIWNSIYSAGPGLCLLVAQLPACAGHGPSSYLMLDASQF